MGSLTAASLFLHQDIAQFISERGRAYVSVWKMWSSSAINVAGLWNQGVKFRQIRHSSILFKRILLRHKPTTRDVSGLWDYIWVTESRESILSKYGRAKNGRFMSRDRAWMAMEATRNDSIHWIQNLTNSEIGVRAVRIDLDSSGCESVHQMGSIKAQFEHLFKRNRIP